MSVIEWVRLSVFVAVIVLSTVLLIVVLVKALKEGFTRKRTATYILALGFLFITYIAYNVKEIEPAGHAQIMLMLGLVVVTGFYALSASRQADASVRMARETKDARFAALKPIIVIDWTSGQHGRAISPYFKNIGLGPALNFKCYCTHTKFEFKGKQDRTTLEVGKREHITLLTEEFDFEGWTGFAINCDYQSIYGEKFRSILRCESEKNRILEIIKLNSGDRND